ncbi:hypothetical protein KEM48_011751 [Puccinia striiformis f. sp. tritici PST-130]|nr:hypothetical protein KEM48_011751 [Puccinia striiformis f. sp. tritici PST-130]
MAIHNLLNPQPSEVQIPMSVVDLFDFECQVSTKWITDTQHLHCNNLLRHLHNHDSEVLVHHGHKRKRKIVGMCLRDADAKYNTLARMHRWNIPTQLDLQHLASNTSVNLDFTAHAFLATGKVDKENP